MTEKFTLNVQHQKCCCVSSTDGQMNLMEFKDLKLNGQTLHQEDTPTYLGVTLDQRHTWKNQLQKNQARAKIRLALMKKLSCTEWGADQNVLKKLYVGRICPVLEYGMAASSTTAKSNSCKLSRVQHQAMRMMTGAMLSTPMSAMETVTGLQPLEDRQEIKVLTQAAKFKRLQDHPMHERMNQPTRGRLKGPTSYSTAGSSKGETLNYWTICPNPFHQSRPSPLGNEDNSQECTLKCQGLQIKAANLSQRGSH